MKATVNITRAIVGILFIVSGLVKANDPLGLSYKMQEFFEIWNSGLAASGFFAKEPLISLFNFFHEYSLALSIIMITLEIIAGAALLLGWKKKFVLNLLLVLIIFFTFLTAYAFLSGKFKNCGCFGDCLPITPLTSFLKDVVLLVMILFLLIYKRYIDPLFQPRMRTGLLAFSLVFSLGLQWYVLNYLPIADCLPYKEGNNISQQMRIPEGAVPDSFAIRFIYEKDGKRHEFSPEGFPADLENYKYVDRIDKLVRKGNAEPAIKGFALQGPNTDSTAIVLNQPEAYLLLVEHFKDPVANWMGSFQQLYAEATSKNIPVYVATAASSAEAATVLFKNGLGEVQIFTTDNTAIRTAARTNPTLLHLQKGTIKEKLSFREIDQAVEQLKKK